MTPAHTARRVSRLTSFVVEIRVHGLLDILEQDAEAEGVRHFAEERHGAVSFKGHHGADEAALVCSVYGSPSNAFRRLEEDRGGPSVPAAHHRVFAARFTVNPTTIHDYDVGALAA